MNDERSLFIIYTFAPPFSYIQFGSGLDFKFPAYHLRANVRFQRDLNHIWLLGNLIGNGRLLFGYWKNDVNNEGGHPRWDYEMWNVSNPRNIAE